MKIQRLLFLCFLLPASLTALAAEDYDLWKQGRVSWYAKDWQKASETFKELIDNYPKSRFLCKSKYYLGYCYDQMGDKTLAFDEFSNLLKTDCPSETLNDAQAKRLQIAFEKAKDEPSYKDVLKNALEEKNTDLRLVAARWLAELGSSSGLNVCFDILESDTNVDRRDSAIRVILKVGDAKDKERLQQMLDAFKQRDHKAPKMVRLIMRDLKTNEETLKVNLPISLFNVLVKSLTEEQLGVIQEEAGIDLRNFNLNLEEMPSGKVLFKVVDKDSTEIKVFLE